MAFASFGGTYMLRLHLAIAFLAVCSVAHAQQGRGAVLGSVTDSSGAAMPNVKVTGTHTSTNLDYNTLTTAEGDYMIPKLPVGRHRVTASAPGMKSVSRSGVQLEGDQKAHVDLQMAPGAV